MSDLFDLPFEDEDEEKDDAAVDSQLSPVDSRQPALDSPGVPADLEPRQRTTGAQQPSADPRPPIRRIHTVTELTVRVRDHLEAEFFEVWVEGELSNCRLWNGHLYYTLKDATSQLRGFMFRSALRYLKFKPADGLRVVARGRISVYEPKGEYQLVCEHLEP